jgi:hypothetical protein
MATPKQEPLTAEEQAQLKAMKPIKEVADALLSLQNGGGNEASVAA